jgi:hypothetical protein
LPETLRLEVIKREIYIRLGLPPGRNNPPIGAISESQIAIFSEKRTVEFALFHNVADDEEQEGFLWSVPQRRMRFVGPQRIQPLKPTRPFGG